MGNLLSKQIVEIKIEPNFRILRDKTFPNHVVKFDATRLALSRRNNTRNSTNMARRSVGRPHQGLGRGPSRRIKMLDEEVEGVGLEGIP